MNAPELPRIDNESDRAYAAFVTYATMGSERSLDKLRQQKAGKSGAHIERWSSRYGWQARVRDYDTALAQLAAAAHAAQYLADLEAHRLRYGDAGKELYEAALELLHELRKRKITLDLTRALPVIARALTTAADLEAHALKLDKLLPTLSTDDNQHPQTP